MAVQKSRKSHSKKGMRRAHHAINSPCLTQDPMTGEVHRRHHVSPTGFYKGEQVICKQADDDSEE